MRETELTSMALSVFRAAGVIASGGCLIYPTETFYGLGAAMRDIPALVRILTIKGRPATKALPLVIGAFEQVFDILPEDFRDGPIYADFSRLAEWFWPGPLSLVLPSRADLPPQIKDPQGRTSVRLTPHPLAAQLCLLAKTPLTATSANRSGASPAAVPLDLDHDLAKLTDGVVCDQPWPGGQAPSTVVTPRGRGELEVVRVGALPESELEEAGFVIVRPGA